MSEFREHVTIDRVLYSVPWAHIGKRVDARVTETLVDIFVDGQLVKSWPRTGRGRCTDERDYPPEKIAFFMRTPVWCRSRAKDLGEHVTEVIAGLLADGALHHLRAAQGIIALGERHGPDRLDAACARAVAAGDPSYRTIKGILAVGAEADPDRPPSTAAASTPAHLHGPDGLFPPGDDAPGVGA